MSAAASEGHPEEAPASPWTIGSTEGISSFMPPLSSSPIIPVGLLIDQAGVRHATPSPPPQFRGGVAIGSNGEAT
jgi:hypothetical protein